MKIDKAELETVISIKVVKGDGTPENPVHNARLYYLPNGTFIGEVEEGGNNSLSARQTVSMSINSKISKEDFRELVDTITEKLADELAASLRLGKQLMRH